MSYHQKLLYFSDIFVSTSGKCTDVLYVVNKLVFELVQTFEKPVVRDLRQIDRAYAQVLSFFFFILPP